MNDRQSLTDRWHDAMRRARKLDPHAIARVINADADTGLRSTRYDRMGTRSTFAPCRDHETCEDGPDKHDHPVTADPTGNLVANRRLIDDTRHELARLDTAHRAFVTNAGVVLHWVCGVTPSTWSGVLRRNATLLPGTIQSGIDVDHERRLPRAIHAVERAVTDVERIASHHRPREATVDEQHWTAGLADEDCCAWHLAIHQRYRRPRAVMLHGERICADCLALYDLGDATRPPAWLLEAEVDRMSKPRAWHGALGRWLDELGIERERSA